MCRAVGGATTRSVTCWNFIVLCVYIIYGKWKHFWLEKTSWKKVIQRWFFPFVLLWVLLCENGNLFQLYNSYYEFTPDMLHDHFVKRVIILEIHSSKIWNYWHKYCKEDTDTNMLLYMWFCKENTNDSRVNT